MLLAKFAQTVAVDFVFFLLLDAVTKRSSMNAQTPCGFGQAQQFTIVFNSSHMAGILLKFFS